MPDAAVIHSHDYAALEQFRRTFDEWRALHEVHGWVQPLEPLHTLLKLQSEVRKDLRGLGRRVRPREVAALACATGPCARQARSPARAPTSCRSRVQAWCSLERRASSES